MLRKLVEEGFGEEEDLNCSETILYGSNIVYDLGLDHESLKMAAGFGKGMAIESVCGALTAAIMVLSKLYIVDRAHEGERIKELTAELLNRYQEDMGSIDCSYLREHYRTEEKKCYYIKLKAAEILDEIIAKEEKSKK